MMKFLILATFAALAHCAAVPGGINDKKIELEDGTLLLTRFVAGPEVEYPLYVSRRTSQGLDEHSMDLVRTLLADNQNEMVRVHHIRNEVPATVHRTVVPESVHAMVPPQVFSRRVIDKHELPVYIP